MKNYDRLLRRISNLTYIQPKFNPKMKDTLKWKLLTKAIVIYAQRCQLRMKYSIVKM